MSEPVGEFTQYLEARLERLRGGDASALEELLRFACDRLMHLTRQMKRDYPGVGRWEQTEDVFQNASIRLYRALETVSVQDAGHFLSLAAQHIRWELIDLAKKYGGPLGLGKHHKTRGVGQPSGQENSSAREFVLDAAEVSQDPQRLAEWSEFHRAIEELPEEQRQLFDLLWYHGLKQEEAAELLKVDVRTVKRRWRSARLALHERLGEVPEF